MLRKAFALLTGQTEEPNSPKPPSEDNHQSYRHTISEDERRLLPDYAQPADAIELPQPEEWAYGQEPSVAIMKPKSTRQLLPLDTMTPRNSRRHSPPPPKRLTFDPSHRATKAYGDSDNEQLQFLKEYETGRGVRSGVMALEDRPGRSIKRRKIYDTSDANAVIDLDADELASTETPAETAWRFARPSTSSRQESILRSTQQSVGTNGGSYARSGGAPVSGFRQTCDITSPHRKKRRRKPNAENGTARRASEEASHGVPSTYDVSDDSDIELLPAQSTSRGKEQPTIREKGETELRLLQSLNPDDSSDLVENPPVSSRFFPKPGFDTFSRTPNSSQRGAASVKGPSKGNPKSRSLRDATFRKGIPTFDENANEPAEAYTAATTPSEFYQSSSHASMHHVKARGQLRYSLFLLRADDVHTSGTDLCLKQKNRGPFNQAEFELVRLSKQTEPIATFNMRNIVALETDSELLVRLKGPENKSGPEFIYDLQFEDPSDCGDFLRRALLSLKAVERDRIYMRNLFKTPHGVRPSPDIRTRFVSSWTLPDNRMSGENPENRRSPKPRRRLVDPLLAAQLDDQSTGAHKPAEKVAAPQDSAVSTTVPSRQSARVTRNSRFHEHVDVAHVVEKAAPVDFGIEEGWGPQWRKPVQYGSGRRRALVNFDDLKRLNEDECLNDAIVDFYMIYLAQQSTSQAEKVYCFNTHFFTTLTQPVAGRKGLINYSRVARWTAKEDLFSYDYIVVPICESMHWYLAIICNMPSLVHRPSPELTEPTEPDPLSVPSPPKTEHHSTGNTPAHEQGPSGDVHMHGTNEMSAEAEEDNGINLFEEEQQLLAENPLDPTALDPARTVDGSLGGESGDYISIPEPDPDDTIPGSTKKEYKQLATKKNFKKIEPDTPIIIILDSLGNTHPRATRALKDYIIEEGKDKRNIETTITHNALYVKDSQIPMQENYTDCGVYLLGYLEKFFRDPTAFVTRILAREMNVHEDWPHMNALDLRRKLLRTLKGLYKEQNEERKEGKRAKRTPASKKEEDAKTETSPKLKSPIRMAQPTRQYLPSSSAPQSNGMSPRRKSPVVLIEHIPQSSNQLAENRIGAQEGRPQHDPPRLRSPARMDIKKGKRPLSVERTSRSSPTSLIKETPPRKQARTRASSESVKAIHSSPASGKDLMELADIVPPTPAVRGTSESVKPVRGSSAAPINIDDSIEMDVVMPRSRRRQLLDTAYEAKAVGYGTSSIEESLRDSEIQETPPPLGEEL